MRHKTVFLDPIYILLHSRNGSQKSPSLPLSIHLSNYDYNLLTCFFFVSLLSFISSVLCQPPLIPQETSDLLRSTLRTAVSSSTNPFIPYVLLFRPHLLVLLPPVLSSSLAVLGPVSHRIRVSYLIS